MEVSRVIELELVGVRVELPHNQPIVLLKERAGERFLPIWIGAVEATSIAFAMQGVVTQRPMTHDLMRDVLNALGVGVDRIVITELRDRTFFAEIQMTRNGTACSVSSRPSDAIALAVRVDAPIFASTEVLDDAANPVSGEAEEQEQIVDEFRQFIEQVNPDDFG
jgi:uncharacterized protein